MLSLKKQNFSYPSGFTESQNHSSWEKPLRSSSLESSFEPLQGTPHSNTEKNPNTYIILSHRRAKRIPWKRETLLCTGHTPTEVSRQLGYSQLRSDLSARHRAGEKNTGSNPSWCKSVQLHSTRLCRFKPAVDLTHSMFCKSIFNSSGPCSAGRAVAFTTPTEINENCVRRKPGFFLLKYLGGAQKL